MSEYVRPDTEGMSAGTNRSAPVTRCETCGGDRFVTVRLRSPEQTLLMAEKNITPSRTSFYEETAPCPACNAVDVSYFRHDGSQFRSMDAAATRKALSE